MSDLFHNFYNDFDPSIEYHCSPFTKSTGWTYLGYLVMGGGNSENIEKIDEYIKLKNTNKIRKKKLKKLKKNDQNKYTNKMYEIINETNAIGWTPLMISCRNSSPQQTQKEINKKEEDNENCKIIGSSDEIVKILLRYGADVNLKDNEGWTALMLAALYSNTDSNVSTVKLLLDAGADVNLKNNEGWTALMLSARYSNTDSNDSTVKLLLDAGADVNLKDIYGWTALMLSVRCSNTDSNDSTVKLLLDAGADVNLKENEGWTTLMLTAQFSDTYSNENTIKLLLDTKLKNDTFTYNNYRGPGINYHLFFTVFFNSIKL